jgi:hypothetical protein
MKMSPEHIAEIVDLNALAEWINRQIRQIEAMEPDNQGGPAIEALRQTTHRLRSIIVRSEPEGPRT